MTDNVKRNLHPDFKKVESSRPEWETTSEFHYTKSIDPHWSFGDGANRLAKDTIFIIGYPDFNYNKEHISNTAKDTRRHITIDPHESGRPAGFNYKLLISSVVPRPIAFISSQAADGTCKNLAPFSYFSMVNHDPPLFVVGFSSSPTSAKDTLRNIVDSRECVINIISEHFVEAANSTSVNAPYGISEWEISGLTPLYDCETVKAARVGEAVFSIEAKLDTLKEYDSKARPGSKSGTVAIFEGTRFWAREDALNEERNLIDPNILKAVSRLGGITYGRTTQGFEIPRPDFEKDIGGKDGFEKIQNRQNGS